MLVKHPDYQMGSESGLQSKTPILQNILGHIVVLLILRRLVMSKVNFILIIIVYREV